MGGVDIADQLRSYYDTQLTSFRTWWPMLFWVFDTMVTNAYFIFRDMPQTPPMTHKEFRLQAAWGLILAKTESKTRRTQSNSQNPPGQQLERTLCFLQEGAVTVGISLSNLRGSERYASSVGRKIGGRENPSFTQISLGLFNMRSPALHDKREKLFHGVSWTVRALKAGEDRICFRKRVWSRIVGLAPSQNLCFYNLLQ